MTKRRKLVTGPVTRVKTEVKEEKVIAGKYLYQIYVSPFINILAEGYCHVGCDGMWVWLVGSWILKEPVASILKVDNHIAAHCRM